MLHQNANHIDITRMFVIDNEIYLYKVILFCTYELINLRHFLFNIVMATVPITSQITTSKDNRTDSDTDLSIVKTEDEIHTDLSTWTPAEKKKLQHMTEFHEEYQCVFSEKASICTIMKCRLSHMNPPIPKSVCEEEMQNANLDTNEVIIEYITDAQGNKIKKLKPLLIKSEPNGEYVQHIPSDDNLPAVPEEKFIQKREQLGQVETLLIGFYFFQNTVKYLTRQLHKCILSDQLGFTWEPANVDNMQYLVPSCQCGYVGNKPIVTKSQVNCPLLFKSMTFATYYTNRRCDFHSYRYLKNQP